MITRMCFCRAVLALGCSATLPGQTIGGLAIGRFSSVPLYPKDGNVSVSLSSAQQSADGLHLIAKGIRPLDEMCLALENRYNWPITYEESPVLAADDLTTLLAPTGRVNIVKRKIPFSVDLSPDELASTGKARLDVIRSILTAYANSRNGESFGATQDQDFIHIVPAAVRGVDGKTAPFEPMLSTRITFPEQHFRTIYDFLGQVLNQVSQRRAVPIVLGTTPTNLFLQTWVFAGANDEPARDVLARAFRDIGGQRQNQGLGAITLVWSMLYDPTGRQYWFNAGVVSGGAPNAQPSRPLPRTPQPNNELNPSSRPGAVRKGN